MGCKEKSISWLLFLMLGSYKNADGRLHHCEDENYSPILKNICILCENNA